MDQEWLTLASSLGYQATIVPQITLNDTAFFDTTDILIISSGTIALPENRVATILAFVQQGGSVYLQTEYQESYTTNMAFQFIVDSLGGQFSWIGEVSGWLVCDVWGNLARIYNIVPEVSSLWYGCEGIGDETIENCLTYQNQNVGFLFRPPDESQRYGYLVTTSDQDWIIESLCYPLMANILSSLLLRHSGIPRIAAEPLNIPIQILSGGGRFQFNLTVENPTNTSIAFYAWSEIALDTSLYLSPAASKPNIILGPGQSRTWLNLTQNVPASALPGDYRYFINTRILPDSMSTSVCFDFEKLAGSRESAEYGSWLLTGWNELLEELYYEVPSPASTLRLMPSNPNPFNISTTLSLNLPETCYLILAIYTPNGRCVTKLIDGWRESGTHTVTFGASNLPSGIYIARLEAGNYQASQKLVLLK